MIKKLKTPLVPKTRDPRDGSALLLTLLIVSLLLAITLAFSMYVRTGLREINSRINRLQAESNAKVSLSLAIGALQHSAGRDRSVNANAELFDGLGMDAAFKRKWVGIWNKRPAGDADEDMSFETYLVSGMEGVAVAERQAALAGFTVEKDQNGSPVNSSNQVVLLGPGSVDTVTDQVVVPRVTAPMTGMEGGFGYWVADQGSKILLTLPDEDMGMISEARLRARAYAPEQMNVEVMEDIGQVVEGLSDASEALLPRLFSPRTAGVLDPQLALAARRKYHDITFQSIGLFTNPLEGGLKKDFSYAFEMSDGGFQRSEFVRDAGDGLSYVTDNDGETPPTKPVFNFVPREPDGAVPEGIPADARHRGATFDLFRDHYRLYQEVDGPFTRPVLSSRAYVPGSYDGEAGRQLSGHITPGELYSGIFERQEFAGDPTLTDEIGARRGAGDGFSRPRFTRTEVAPEIVRFLILYSMTVSNERPSTDPAALPDQREGDVTLIMEPLVYLHNPYNVAIEFDAVRLMVLRNDFGMAAYAMNTPDGMNNDDITGKFRPGGGRSNITAYVQREIEATRPGGVTTEEQGLEMSMDVVVTRTGLPVTRPVRLEPGEVKVFTNGGSGVRPVSDDYKMILTEAVGADAFSGGLSMRYLDVMEPNPTRFVLQSNQWLGVKFDYFGGPHDSSRGDQPWVAQYDQMQYGYLTSFLLERGNANSLPRGAVDDSPGLRRLVMWPNAFLSGHNGGGDDMSVVSIPYSFMAGGTDSDPEKFYIGYTDFYMKPSKPDHYPTEVFTHHATRAIALNPNLNGAVGKNGARIVPTWGLTVANETEARTGAEPRDRLSFGLDGEGVWGRSLQQVDGNERVILYDVPTKPLTSLAEFQHLNHQIFPWEPSYAIGNSRASPYVPRDRLWNRREQSYRGADMHASQFDVSYLYNQALWDRYFFSSISSPVLASGAGYDSGESMSGKIRQWEDAPLNPRVVPLPGSDQAERLAALDESRYSALGTQTAHDADVPHNRVAEFYGLAGAFNVNSVSVEAWKALLGSLSGGDVSLADEDGEVRTYTLDDFAVYYPRTALQGGDDAPTAEMRWKGLGSLTDAQLEVFAENIVREVRERSRRRGVPFSSLAEFVNREVDSGEDGLVGVIQAAIDAGEGGDSFNRDLVMDEGVPAKLDGSDESDIFVYYTQFPNQMANLVNPHSDSTFLPYPAPDHFRETSGAGISGYVSQADVLSVIGSQLTVRSDTFVVRAYGSVGDAGSPAARAWCEAVVQRVPDYVEPEADGAYVHPENLSSPVNPMFGRQFRIVSFRWLTREEI